MKKMIALSLVACLTTALSATDADTQAQIDALSKEITKLKKDQKRTKKTLNKVKAHDAYDNIKFGIDFRNAVDSISYKYNDFTIPASGTTPAKDISGTTAKNKSLITSRLYLTMKSAPIEGLMFSGKLAIYNTWGAHLHVEDPALKDWSASSKPSDSVMRIKEAYAVYSTSMGSQPISFSIGRRPSTNSFLANYRENEPVAGSPLAHITNMEVNGIMTKLSWDRFISGAYTKFVYGRAHTGEMNEVYGKTWVGKMPFADLDTDKEDEVVDFAVILGDAYNDGQYQLMYQWAHIFNTKGKQTAPDKTGNNPKGIKGNAGVADLFALSLKVDGIGDEISDFLDETTIFLSAANTKYTARDGHSLLGSTDGGSKSGNSFWIGAIFPDMMTESGKFGIEYNHGSKYWTPITWAEDTVIGSKISVRGDAYEAYWNFNLFGVKHLPSQVRYTYAQHDYTPNFQCAGWIEPKEVDIVAQDLRIAVSYRY